MQVQRQVIDVRETRVVLATYPELAGRLLG